MGIKKLMIKINKKIMMIIGLFVIVIVLFSVVFIIIDSSKTKTDPTKEASYTITYVDPGSGETVITTPNKNPERINGNAITMLGFSKLVSDYGMTFDQVKYLQSKFSNYSSALKTPIKEISITLASITTTVDSNTGDVVDEFTVTIDRTSTLKARVSYFGIDNPTLKLYSPTNNKLIFTSK
jgi:ABC-type glycerol-3-phosphate transport system permease component